jgi:hypothetical protein
MPSQSFTLGLTLIAAPQLVSVALRHRSFRLDLPALTYDFSTRQVQLVSLPLFFKFTNARTHATSITAVASISMSKSSRASEETPSQVLAGIFPATNFLRRAALIISACSRR